ncbi:MAG TPA: hypothetical protein DEG17_09225 [Cyanobacteria bacterium UBA11149]|nr:hypothetical protein [Cyanobacteria bacterium UBA11367]HBE57509.1 hypothetical protein [Cyanobacteria bacterium UBA11366]HBK66675.1 hypothetical protein [Cyanobacteria bacterium UBA11166]HBR73603.1 hypothetical protein [Cyanobacteria bacterium UBA11159]HBS68096.1 hypothetical protein [Cyanobacteria bacterium UBA11153]HBW89031.1 hypothetical protein [Cyanobacteria bacterium UBA11149]HCA96733.1 hypothetical protein [Cyanobacteria bacterium UBA9226]
MEETIKIRSIPKSDWQGTLQGFQSSEIKQVLEIYSAEGTVIGSICQSVRGKYYINGEPESSYASLESATGAMLKNQ